MEQLYRKGLERKARLLALQRTRAEIDGNRAERRARIAQAQQAIGEAELQTWLRTPPRTKRVQRGGQPHSIRRNLC